MEELKWLSEKSIHDITNFDYPSNSKRCSSKKKTLKTTLLFVYFSESFVSIHRGKIEQILLAIWLPKETAAATMMLYKNIKVKVRSLDGDTDHFDIVADVLQVYTLAPYLLIISQDYVLRTPIKLMKENGFTLAKERSRKSPAQTITNAEYADDIVLRENAPTQAEYLLHNLERGAGCIAPSCECKQDRIHVL